MTTITAQVKGIIDFTVKHSTGDDTLYTVIDKSLTSIDREGLTVDRDEAVKQIEHRFIEYITAGI